MAGHRAARLEVSRDQNRAGSPSDSSQDSQATCASVVVAHCREQAGLAEAGGSHQEHQRLGSGLQPSEQGSALHPGPGGPGHSDLLALDGHAVFGLDGIAPLGDLGRGTLPGQAPPGSPRRG